MKTGLYIMGLSAACAALFCCARIPAFANGGGTDSGYSPYSKFGIGTLNRKGTAYNATMGGVGTASRDHQFINIVNPASVTARDSLSFMVDFNVENDNRYFRQNTDGGTLESVNNTFNFSGFSFSFPIWRSSAMMVGIVPFSSVGYDFAHKLDNPDYYPVTGRTGNISDAYTGQGSIYNLFAAGGVTFFKRLSIGAQFDYYFGNLEKSYVRKFATSGYRSIYDGDLIHMQGFGGKFGVQYEQPIGRHRLIVGGTYRLKTDLVGSSIHLRYASQSDIADTLTNKIVNLHDAGVNIPWEYSVGISFGELNRWTAEFNYTMSDWTKSRMEGTSGFSAKGFSATANRLFNCGFSVTPNRGDIRYYMKRVTYRLGAYYNKESYFLNGTQISSYAITAGMTFPVFKWFNGLTVGAEFGRRGTLQNGLIRETFVNFSIAINLFDIWFVKPTYE